ncbi:PAS domain S-box protein [Cellulomonas shaoxiangyii]|uniref:histidine kinase n=1 Tax=Cellulomonas shaoxiangyii TaxID=2566013 RepID=A0A4P7SM79_9CELL|nr:PAS domain S-box protein [Cellulomonas shaoxiangyii]TGY86730.1 PAS domain S-box protein [Cellulomonas shaoxiangyii]
MTTGHALPPGGRVAADRAPSASPLPRALTRRLWPDGTVLERQLPFAVLSAAAAVTLGLPGIDVTAVAPVVVAGGLTLASLVLALVVPWRRLRPSAQDVLPLLQIAAVAALRMGTGGLGSPYAALVYLPVITLSARPGRARILVATLATAATVAASSWLDPTVDQDVVVLRSFLVAASALAISVFVHETTERQRAYSARLEGLQVAQTELLERTRESAVALQRVASTRRAARDQLISVIDSATEQAIIATDREGRVEVFNPGAERLLGYAQGEVVGRMHLTDFHVRAEIDERRPRHRGSPPRGGSDALAEQRELVEALVAPARAGSADVRDWTYVRGDRTTVIVRLAVTRRVEPDGSVSGYVVVATDVTAEREAALLKDQFLGLVSHELRTPLTSVLGYLELLLDGTEPLSDEQREYLQVVERNARRQLRLVSDLLLSAQVDAGTFAITPQPTDLGAVARASLASAAPAAEQAGVTLVPAVQDAPLVADPVRLGQAVDNLVSNAVKFTPPGGSVRVEVAPLPDGGALLAVSDTGIGIPADELGDLTARFFRASNAARRAIPGVGLGLSITKAVIDAHGGELDVQSTVGEGTTFVVSLPAVPPGDR